MGEGHFWCWWIEACLCLFEGLRRYSHRGCIQSEINVTESSFIWKSGLNAQQCFQNRNKEKADFDANMKKASTKTVNNQASNNTVKTGSNQASNNTVKTGRSPKK